MHFTLNSQFLVMPEKFELATDIWLMLSNHVFMYVTYSTCIIHMYIIIFGNKHICD